MVPDSLASSLHTSVPTEETVRVAVSEHRARLILEAWPLGSPQFARRMLWVMPLLFKFLTGPVTITGLQESDHVPAVKIWSGRQS